MKYYKHLKKNKISDMSIPGEYIKQGETTEEGILKILNKYRRKKKSCMDIQNTFYYDKLRLCPSDKVN